MDPLTHTLLGASLGYAGFHRRLGRTAALVGGLAGLIPDADIFIHSASDPLLAVHYHRFFSHSLLFAPVGAALVAALWMVRPAWRPQAWALWGCALLAYFSHCLLDAATTYGTVLLWPLSDHRFAWHTISVIDPIVTLALAGGLIPALVRSRGRPAVIGLMVAAGYFGFGIIQQTRASAVVAALASHRGHVPERLIAMPTLGNLFVWRGLYLHEGMLHSDRIRVAGSMPTSRAGWALPHLAGAGDLTASERARAVSDSFARFAWFTAGWIARSPDEPALLGDARYGTAVGQFEPVWGIRFTPMDALAEVEWVDRSRSRRVDPQELWRELRGLDPRHRPI